MYGLPNATAKLYEARYRNNVPQEPAQYGADCIQYIQKIFGEKFFKEAKLRDKSGI